MTLDWLDILTTILGLIYIWLEYRAHIALWVVGIIMPALDVILYWNHGLYGDAGMACYYTLAAVYGLIMWSLSPNPSPSREGSGEHEVSSTVSELPITHMPLSKYLPATLFFFAAWGATYYVLITWTNSTVPLLDSFTNALSFVGVGTQIYRAVVLLDCRRRGLLHALRTERHSLQGRSLRTLCRHRYSRIFQMEKTFDAVIIANGAFPTHAVPLDILHHAAHLIACDGAIAPLLLEGLGEAVIIGDGDSVPAEFRDRLIQITEQDDNDQTKATRYCVEHGWKRIAYLGSTGKREDHTLGNISLLMRYYREWGVEGTMFTDYGFFTPAYGNRTFNTMKGQQISVFNFGCHLLTSEGLRWDAYNFSEWWQGTLNEALGDTFSIHADGYYLVYQTYEAK